MRYAHTNIIAKDWRALADFIELNSEKVLTISEFMSE